jgi:tRNA (guanine37-N1)-methyltransferase
MIVDVLTLFPGMFDSVLGSSILGRAVSAGQIRVNLRDFREFASGVHRKVDDSPYGGGPGMVLKPEPVVRAVRACASGNWPGEPPGELPSPRLIMLTPQGRRMNQALVRELAAEQRLLLLCGHYEGFDERIRLAFPWTEVSIGDYVLTGGELSAMVLIDAVARLLPGVLGDGDSTQEESFEDGLLEYPQYTRPPEFEGMKVPDILLGGHHAKIAEWRQELARRRTRERRPDLWEAWIAAHPPEEPRKRKGRRARKPAAGDETPDVSLRDDPEGPAAERTGP